MTSVRLKPFCFFVFVFSPQRARQLKAAAVISPSQQESTLRTRKPRVLPLSYFLTSPALIARNPISLEAHLLSSNPHHQNLQWFWERPLCEDSNSCQPGHKRLFSFLFFTEPANFRIPIGLRWRNEDQLPRLIKKEWQQTYRDWAGRFLNQNNYWIERSILMCCSLEFL